MTRPLPPRVVAAVARGMLRQDPSLIVTLGREEMFGQTVDFWVGAWPARAATLHRGGKTADRLTIEADCPSAWLPGITGIWTLLGDNPDADLSRFATHRLVADRNTTTLEPLA